MSTPKKAIKKFIYKIKLKVLRTHLNFAFFNPPTLFEIDFFEETFLEPIDLTWGETQIPSGIKTKRNSQMAHLWPQEINNYQLTCPQKSLLTVTQM